ncbi:uncharacterized protein LOC125072293 [Vanessa atalanta]|uniref:uncharacterized protein LOC125072293 n=1 Tax=Vanessa atalanta TaxID=42275 RepID=UPI001FCD6FC3|nr:uncharacterized protein LOC125072293 [Vanessa atalanta]
MVHEVQLRPISIAVRTVSDIKELVRLDMAHIGMVLIIMVHTTMDIMDIAGIMGIMDTMDTMDIMAIKSLVSSDTIFGDHGEDLDMRDLVVAEKNLKDLAEASLVVVQKSAEGTVATEEI